MLSFTLFSLYKSSHSEDIKTPYKKAHSSFEYVVITNAVKSAQIAHTHKATTMSKENKIMALVFPKNNLIHTSINKNTQPLKIG